MRRFGETALLWLAGLLLAAGVTLAGCSDDTGSTQRDTGGDADAGGDAESDLDAAPDLEPDGEPDVTEVGDLGPDGEDGGDLADANDIAEEPDAADVAEEEVIEVPPSFQLVYAAQPDDVVGITDVMGIHATADRLYVTGLWEDTARVSYFPRDALTFPWCLYDQLGWPTGVAENPATGDLWVADMVYGLVVITPPEEPGDCGCDAVVSEACPAERTDFAGVTGLGGVTISDAGRIFVSGLDLVTHERTIWEVQVDGDTVALDPIFSGRAVGDTIGVHVDPEGRFLYLASSDGSLSAYRVEAEGLGVGAEIRRGEPGFPTDISADTRYYYWPSQDPFAYPGTDRGGSVLRSSLDGFVVTTFGEGDLVWPGGVSAVDGDWFVVDRATGIWGYY